MSAATAWKWMPFSLLLLTVLFAAWRIELALNDPHFAAVDDYYRQAADWDKHMEEVRTSQALGWRMTLSPVRADDRQVQDVLFSLQDAEGNPVPGVTGELTAYHNAYPKQRVVIDLEGLESGTYRARVLLDRPGIWNWQFRLHRGEQLWIGEMQEIVDRDPRSAAG
ncbi:MAG: FixH family protein [Planctomycetota bacterium]|jgi:nitrogen fixation protein FixH